MVGRFDAFGDDLMPESGAEADHAFDDGQIVRIPQHVVHERLVDLQGIDRQLAQVGEGGEAGAEVVQRKAHALAGAKANLRQSLAAGDGTARIGAVVFIHRFGALMNAHLHFHVIAIDGVFFGEETASLRFEETHLSAQALARLQSTLRKRIVSLFVRRGLLDQSEGEALRRCAHGGGFSLDAGVRIEGADRQGRERLLRYCARPAFAQERLRQIDAEHLGDCGQFSD